MAKKQTRRSISVSRATYERLKAFCETQGISMSQFVETRVGDFLSEEGETPQMVVRPEPARPAPAPNPRPITAPPKPTAAPVRPTPGATMITSAAARFAVEPPLPIIKPRGEPADVKPPTVPTADQIFTF